MVDEIREGRCFAIFFTHKQQRNEGRQETRAGGQPLLFGSNKLSQPFAVWTVADLIMILREDDKALRRLSQGGCAMPPTTETRILSGVGKPLLIALR